MLYELVTLTAPFPSSSLYELVNAIVSVRVRPIEKKIYSENVYSLIDSLLTKDANSRPNIEKIMFVSSIYVNLTTIVNIQKMLYIKFIYNKEN